MEPQMTTTSNTEFDSYSVILTSVGSRFEYPNMCQCYIVIVVLFG